MYKVVLTIGHNVNGFERWDAERIIKAFVAVTAREAFTVYDVNGFWRGEFEVSTRIEIDGLNKQEASSLREVVPVLADILKQDSIMFTCEQSTVEFVGAVEIKRVKAVA